MAAVLNGLGLHGGFRPFGSTFLVFSDYLRPALRLSRADAAAGDLRADPRLGRGRRGRPHPPAGRARRVAAADPGPAGAAARRRRRDGRGLAARAGAHRRADRADPDAGRPPALAGSCRGTARAGRAAYATTAASACRDRGHRLRGRAGRRRGRRHWPAAASSARVVSPRWTATAYRRPTPAGARASRSRPASPPAGAAWSTSADRHRRVRCVRARATGSLAQSASPSTRSPRRDPRRSSPPAPTSGGLTMPDQTDADGPLRGPTGAGR